MSDITVQLWLQNSAACMQSGDLGQAEKYCRQVLDLEPANPQALHRLGMIAVHAQRLDVALQLISRAIQLAPYSARYCNDLGEVYRAVGNIDAALSFWHKALAIDPNQADARRNLDHLVAAARTAPQAEEIFRRILMVYPSFDSARNALAHLWAENGKLDEAVALWCERRQQDPTQLQGDVLAAVALAQANRLTESLQLLDDLLQTNPDLLSAHVNRGMVMFQLGNLGEAFKEFDWHWQMRSRAGARRQFRQPRWDGSPLEGRTLMLLAEQGLGDALQLVRFVPQAVEKAGEGKIALACDPALVRLFKTIKGIHVLPIDGQMPRFDLQCPLAYLPVILQSTHETLSLKMPYLSPYRRDFEQFGADIAALQTAANGSSAGPPHKIGLCWAGGPAHPNDAHRSIPLAMMLPLLKLKGVTFFSFQKGAAREQLAALAESSPESAAEIRGIVDWSDRLNDFADTSALLAHMDLLISVDTAVAHLAGAMGRRVWTLLPKEHLDWRWYPISRGMPWYPTMRLFHQTTPGDWQGVIERVATAVARNLKQPE